MKTVNCSFCGNPLEVEEGLPLYATIVNNGAINKFACGYGSKFDTTYMLLAICDTCLEKCCPIEVFNYITEEKEND